MEKAGLENAGTSCAWVSKCNIISVRGHVRVDVTAGRGDLRTLQEATVNATAATANETDNCEVCLVAQREPRLALVPCGHQRFCESCIRHIMFLSTLYLSISHSIDGGRAFSTPVYFMVPRFPVPRFQRPRGNIHAPVSSISQSVWPQCDNYPHRQTDRQTDRQTTHAIRQTVPR